MCDCIRMAIPNGKSARLLLPVGFVVVFLAGCATTDPREDNIVSAIAGAGGGHEKYIDNQKTRLGQSKLQVEQQESQKQTNVALLTATEAEIAELRKDIGNLEKDIASYQARVELARRKGTADRKKLADLEQKFRQLQDDTKRLDRDAEMMHKSEAILRERLGSLEVKRKELLTILDMLSGG
ncbi:MAG: hypothetical protein HPY30_10860 [Gammaproteobacteria bacterium (ex Lamellibrachia satsuma)]|nr:MAG: hypothetical protein HPY30_10860 [Gammaproteobacteria bacterium (ex Lamellibrachia satsuma)]